MLTIFSLEPCSGNHNLVATLIKCLTHWITINADNKDIVAAVVYSLQHINYFPTGDRRFEHNLSELKSEKEKRDFILKGEFNSGTLDDWILQVVGNYQGVTVKNEILLYFSLKRKWEIILSPRQQ